MNLGSWRSLSSLMTSLRRMNSNDNTGKNSNSTGLIAFLLTFNDLELHKNRKVLLASIRRDINKII